MSYQFHIGQKVVSLRDMPNYGRRAGEVFTVMGFSSCKCGPVIDVGITTPNPNGCKCTKCGWVFGGPTVYGLARFFRPLLGNEQSELDAIEEEVKETELIPA